MNLRRYAILSPRWLQTESPEIAVPEGATMTEQPRSTLANLSFVLGGARSAKSRHAEELVTAHQAPWTYLAAAQAFDAEMEERIAEHCARREHGRETLDIPFALARLFRDHAGRLNQMVAAAADTVVLTVAGLPMRVK